MFEKERFISDCLAALKEDDTHSAMRELVSAAVTTPNEIIRWLGEPKRAGRDSLEGKGFDHSQFMLGTLHEIQAA